MTRPYTATDGAADRELPAFPHLAPNLIAGEIHLGGGEQLPVFDPSRGAVIAKLAEADAMTVAAAVDVARTAFASGVWSKLPVAERQAVLYRAADLLRAHVDELAKLETLAAGLPLAFSSRRQVLGGANWLKYFAERIGSFSGAVHRQLPGATTLVVHEPRGVAAQFSPWNVPVGIALLKIAAAISVGNSVVLKPSEQAPLAILRVVQLLHDAGLPPGVLNLVNGRGPVTGAALAESDGIDCISFTGGGVAGRAIATAAAARYLPYVLELGGKSACVIFDDADLEHALDGALLGIYSNNGQACLAGARILVHEKIADAFIARFVERTQKIRIGDPFDPAVEMGPIASEKHLEHVLGFVASAREEGDRILYGGERRADLGRGYYMNPVVAETENAGGRLFQEEVFGPFATFHRFGDEAQAFELANATRYGLVAYLWTRDHARVLRGYRALQAGTVLVNCAMLRETNAPFGGVGESGVGREGGDDSLRFYTQEKTVVMAEDWQAGHRLGGNGS